MTDIEQLDKCISWHFVAGTISREARDAWNRILAERSADKARIAAAEGVAADMRSTLDDMYAHRTTYTKPSSLSGWIDRLSQSASPAPVSEPQPADPNSSATPAISGEQVEVVGYWDGESEVFSKSVDSGPDDEPLVYKSDYDALRAEHAAIAADLLATAQRYHERAIAAERKLDAYRVAVREMFLMVEQYNNFNPAAAWLSARVAEIVGGAK